MADKILVSGASGFIASHIIEKLLAAGSEIVGTVRDPANYEKTAHLMTMKGAETHLTLVAADLNDSDPFSDYVDVDIIMHTASPYVLTVKNAQRDLVAPAVNGTLSMLTAAAKSKRVRRVILTSSMAAVTDEPDGRLLTEADWNNESSLTRNPYFYSKVLAERAAWDFMKRENPHFDLIVINPFLVIGPAHTASINTSHQILVDLVNGNFPAIIDLTWGFVDVRDVADAHIAAANIQAASGRYVCATATIDMSKVVDIARANGWGHAKLPKMSLTGPLGTALTKLASYTQPSGAGSYLRTHVGRALRFDNSKIRNELAINFRSPETSIRDALVDLAKWNHIPQPR
ncbi:MAG: NAD-dependent epimerase/dehydratase family protein [Rhizobiales bacterium]|nr:NAD-dependent epimerase/dehydratase family protein [Hyphomicrobiales bacterium]